MLQTALKWNMDSYGCVLPAGSDPQRPHLWIHQRPSYCDRGHWEVGSYADIPISTYFMSAAVAMAEAEMALDPQKAAEATRVARVERHHQAPDGCWTKNEPTGDLQGFFKKESGSSVYAVIRYVEEAGIDSPHWRLEVTGLPDEDGADCFPRSYYSRANAASETTRFMAWRLHKHPYEESLSLSELCDQSGLGEEETTKLTPV